MRSLRRAGGRRKRARRLFVLVSAALPAGLCSADLSGQQEESPRTGAGERPRAVFAVVPDTVRVGETFLLGVAVRVGPEAEVRFPDTLATGRFYDQRGPVDRERPEPGLWRADYTLVPWRADPGPFPPVEVEVTADGEVKSYRFEPQPPLVPSVLPADADAEGLELRAPRDFLLDEGIPWLLVLAVLAVVVGLVSWLILRARQETAPRGSDEERDDERSPADRARDRLRELEAAARDGALREPEFYDRLEETLRTYAEATRGWAPGVPLRHLADGDSELKRTLQRSALSRFAGLETGEEGRMRALEICRAWLDEEP